MPILMIRNVSGLWLTRLWRGASLRAATSPGRNPRHRSPCELASKRLCLLVHVSGSGLVRSLVALARTMYYDPNVDIQSRVASPQNRTFVNVRLLARSDRKQSVRCQG